MNNVKKLRKAAKLTQKKLGELSDLSESMISNIENEQKNPSLDAAYRIAEVLGCSVADLGLREEVSTVPQVEQSEMEYKYSCLDEHGKAVIDFILDMEYKRCLEEKVVDFGTIRHYLSSPAAGINGMTSEDYEDIPRTKDMPKDADFCLTVSGDSMEPYIHDGEIVFVNEKAQLQDFEVGVWCVDGATYVKQFCKSYDGNLYLLSANPEREDANITIFKDGNQSVQYFGKVLLDKKLPQPYYKP